MKLGMLLRAASGFLAGGIHEVRHQEDLLAQTDLNQESAIRRGLLQHQRQPADYLLS